jgi:hypothetical protein
MLKRFLHGFAYLLVILMPLQSVAAANMLVCNSLMQANHKPLQIKSATGAIVDNMPCHEARSDITDHSKQPSSTSVEKGHCSTLCSSLCNVAALPHPLNLSLNTNGLTVAIAIDQTYVSITLPAFQRPPIFLS